MTKKFDANKLIRYDPPGIPTGRLRINKRGEFFEFPIEEESVCDLVDELQKSLKEAYEAGVKSVEKPQSASGRLKRVYIKDNRVMIASSCRSIIRPEKIEYLDFPKLLVSQINMMLEEAEERGRVEGYEDRIREEDIESD